MAPGEGVTREGTIDGGGRTARVVVTNCLTVPAQPPLASWDAVIAVASGAS